MNLKPLLEVLESLAKAISCLNLVRRVREGAASVRFAGRRVASYPIPEFQGDRDLFGLYEAVRLDGTQERFGVFAIQDKGPEAGVTGFGIIARVDEATTKMLLEGIEGASICHSDSNVELERRTVGDLSGSILRDLDATLSVKESGEVLDGSGHGSFHRGLVKKLTKSGETQNGQSRAKQGGYGPLGVCREQMSAPKGKGCSELAGNSKSEAETISPLTIVPVNCNRTVYHRSALANVQIIMTQNSTGDLAFQTLRYHGISWYWSRNIAPGRLYMFRPEDLFFWVHEQGNFVLSEFRRSWNQDLFGASMLLMCVFGARRRVFAQVLDGITA